MTLMTLTPKLIVAVSRDAANSQMQAAGRTKWSRADARLACETQARLMQKHGDYCQQLAADEALRRMEKPLPKNVPF